MEKNKLLCLSLSTMFLLISCTSSDSKFVGTWESTISGEESTFTITKYGESFLFDGEDAGFKGTYTKTKEGSLFLEYNYGMRITVLYDNKSKQLIWSTPTQTRYFTKVKEPKTK